MPKSIAVGPRMRIKIAIGIKVTLLICHRQEQGESVKAAV
jgi:hypothetical protein